MTSAAQTIRTDEIQAVRQLRARIRAEGLDRPTPVLAGAVYAFHISTMLAGIAAFVASDDIVVKAAALAVSTYGALGVSTSAHCASHNTLTGIRWLDRVLTLLGYSLLLGLSEAYWRHKHVRVHHSEPNNVDIDDDIDLKPFFILAEEDMAAASGWRRSFYRIQHWVLPLALALNGLNMQKYGATFLAQQLRGKQHWSAYEWADIACLIGHVALFLVIPSVFWPAWQVVLFYLLRMALVGFAMFAAFAPAHFPTEAVFVRTDREALGPIARHLYTTVNFRAGFWGRLVLGGVDHQIEHHLLPEVNQHKMARASQIVREFCEETGYPYRTLGWGEAIVKSVLSLKTLRPIHRSSELAETGLPRAIEAAPAVAETSAPVAAEPAIEETAQLIRGADGEPIAATRFVPAEEAAAPLLIVNHAMGNVPRRYAATARDWTRQAVDALLAFCPNAQADRRCLAARARGIAAIGRAGLFDAESFARFGSRVCAWLAQRLGPGGQFADGHSAGLAPLVARRAPAAHRRGHRLCHA